MHIRARAPAQPCDRACVAAAAAHGFVEQWRLRHPHVRFELIEAEKQKRAGLFLSDPVAVGQIFTILLDNAARASRDSVTLTTSASRHLGEPVIQFDVRDQAAGIPAALRGSLGATPVDSTQGGHGVGLYLAFSAATRLGGSIKLMPASPHGTHAILRLADTSSPELREKAARTGRGGVATALRLANTQKFGQITVDLHLGNDSELTLVAPLRELQPDARILVLMGYASIATAVQAVRRSRR